VISVPDSLSRVDRMLLGEGVPAQKAAQYSREFAVDRNTPPTFLVHARDDKAVDVTYSTSFYDKLRKKGVPAEIYLYETGGHGFGLTNKTSPEKWTDRLKVWMRDSLKVLPAGR
jgi:acetyl esterase/lipase